MVDRGGLIESWAILTHTMKKYRPNQKLYFPKQCKVITLFLRSYFSCLELNQGIECKLSSLIGIASQRTNYLIELSFITSGQQEKGNCTTKQSPSNNWRLLLVLISTVVFTTLHEFQLSLCTEHKIRCTLDLPQWWYYQYL